MPEELRPGDRVKWGEQVELPSTESLLETLRSLNPDLDRMLEDSIGVCSAWNAEDCKCDEMVSAMTKPPERSGH